MTAEGCIGPDVTVSTLAAALATLDAKVYSRSAAVLVIGSINASNGASSSTDRRGLATAHVTDANKQAC